VTNLWVRGEESVELGAEDSLMDKAEPGPWTQLKVDVSKGVHSLQTRFETMRTRSYVLLALALVACASFVKVRVPCRAHTLPSPYSQTGATYQQISLSYLLGLFVFGTLKAVGSATACMVQWTGAS
jgi:hypothetical protein